MGTRPGRLTRAQKLGVYLIIVGLLEAAPLFLKRFPFLPTPFPSHGGLVEAVLIRIFPTGGRSVYMLRDVVSFSWPLVIGVMFVLGRRPLKTYIGFEIALSAPTLLIGIELARMGGGHVLTKGNGLSLLLMFVFSAAVPVLWAIFALKESHSRNAA